MKKHCLFFAVLVMSFMFAMSASALKSSGRCGDNVFYTYNSTTKEAIISGTGDTTVYYSATDSPFANSDVKSVVIEDGVTSIGQNLFYSCCDLESVTIGNSVKSIDYKAFLFCNNITNFNVDENNCYYSSIDGVLFNDEKTDLIAYPIGNTRLSYNIPNGVTSIKRSAFESCKSLELLVIPNSVKSIGDYAFWGCENLTSIYIGNSVINIGKMVFIACSNLTSIYVDAKNSVYYSLDGVLFDKNKKELVQYPVGSLRSSYIIPDNITSLGEWAFRCCTSLTNITIPDDVTNICDKAFYDCINISNVYYYGNKYQWKNMAIGLENYYLTNATIHYHYGKPHIYTEVVTNPSCIAQGYTTYICECGDTYIDDYVDANGHNHKSEITTPATHLAEGVETYTCHCGDTYTKPIAKLPDHTHNAVVTLPTCEDKGFTTYTCECGDTYIDDYVDENGHSYTSEITTPATHLEEGVRTYTCECTHSYTESISKLTEHTYEETVTAPTCTTPGYTTYKCECGDSYIDNFVDETHTFSNEWTIDEDPTCKYEGVKSRHCKFCPARTDITAIGKLAHNFVSVRIEPSCLDEGYIMTACNCGEEIIETIAPTGHSFNGLTCTECDYDKSVDCSCNCHKSGIAHLIFKIILFFQRLFRANGECACGVRHY